MFSHSSSTVRVSGIPLDAEIQDLEEYAQWLSSGSLGKSSLLRRMVAFRANADVGTEPCTVSLAPQMPYKTGTVTFPSETLKKRAIEKRGKWKCDDVFNWLTVLYSAASPDLDICAVHGLNGHAFDTWTTDRRMWLRDFMPNHERFRSSRIMTFGYSSLFMDDRNTAGLAEWAHSLLQSLVPLRKSEAERARPIIFVCHSLGGLVAREAMIQLHSFPDRYQGLRIENCGLLFLSTPHSGATAADWNNYLLELAQRIGRVRARSFTNLLGSFNNESRRTKERFGLINPAPPYVCLGETRETTIRGYAKMIVTLDSAGLNNEPAQGVDGADHKTICKYARDTDAGYVQILERLEYLGSRLQSATSDTANTTVDAGPRGKRTPDSRDNDAPTASVRGGNARGGDARGSSAQGGHARGGSASVASGWNGGAYGGSAQGGDAKGGDAYGGDAYGGDARSS